MSHSPRALQDKAVLTKYQNGWQTTSRLLREGKSFSGHEPNCAYLNCDGSSFANVSAVTGLDFADDGRAVCVTDWDHDGDLDLWFHNRTGPRLRLMRNRLIETADEQTSNFVVLRLRGTVSNRDAVGARVMVRTADESKPRIQTLHAGDSFLSQSSKTLHFGLAAATQITAVKVRWPNGLQQEFDGLDVNHRYELIEGDSVAKPIPRRRPQLAFVESVQPAITSDAQVRTVLSNRLPLPLLPYQTFDGRESTIERPRRGSSKLVVLAASWCPNCREELIGLKEHADALKQAGVELLVVGLDGLDVQQQSGPADVRQFVTDLNLPFDVGVGKPDLLKKLELAQSVVLNRTPPFAVPLNLLVDSGGALAVIYRGPVGASQILEDASQLRRSPLDRRDAAVPFAGTWTTPPRQMLLRAVGHLFGENGFDEDRLRYAQLDAEMLERQRNLAASPEQRAQLDAVYVAENYHVGVALLARNKPNQAAEYFERVVAVDPQHVNATVNLATHFAKQQKTNAALELLRKAINVEPDSVAARSSLGNILSGTGQFSAAAKQYSHIVKANKATASIHSRLARALLELGEVEEGTAQLEQAVEKGAGDAATLVSLAWIKATSQNEELRDGDRAMELASRIRSNRLGSPVVAFDVIAAARAEQGDFGKAIAAASKAIGLLGGKNPKFRQQINERIAAYQQKRAHRDKDGKYP